MDKDTVETQSDSLEDLRDLLGLDFPPNSIVEFKEAQVFTDRITLLDKIDVQIWFVPVGYKGKVKRVVNNKVEIELIWVDGGKRVIQIPKNKLKLVDVM